MTWREEHCPRSAPEACCPPSSTSHVPGQRAAPGLSTTHGIGHPGLRPSPHPHAPGQRPPQGWARSAAWVEAHRYVETPSGSRTNGVPGPPLVLHGPVTQCHSHAHTGSHTHTPTRARTLTRSHAHTGSHTHTPTRARTHAAHRLTPMSLAPRAPRTHSSCKGRPWTVFQDSDSRALVDRFLREPGSRQTL